MKILELLLQLLSNGNECALLEIKDHLNVFIYGPIAEDPEHIINRKKIIRQPEQYKCIKDCLNESVLVHLAKTSKNATTCYGNLKAK